MKPSTPLVSIVHAIIACLCLEAHAATLLNWSDSPNNGLTPGVPHPATYTTGGAFSINGYTASAFGSGAAIISVAQAQSASMSLTRYFELSLTPDSGYVLDIDTFDVNVRAVNTPSWTVRSSLDSFAVDLIAPTTSSTLTPITLGSAFDNISTTITFRVYMWNSGGAGAEVGLENGGGATSLQGNVIAVPEPSSILLLAIGSIAIILFRKRRSCTARPTA